MAIMGDLTVKFDVNGNPAEIIVKNDSYSYEVRLQLPLKNGSVLHLGTGFQRGRHLQDLAIDLSLSSKLRDHLGTTQYTLIRDLGGRLEATRYFAPIWEHHVFPELLSIAGLEELLSRVGSDEHKSLSRVNQLQQLELFLANNVWTAARARQPVVNEQGARLKSREIESWLESIKEWAIRPYEYGYRSVVPLGLEYLIENHPLFEGVQNFIPPAEKKSGAIAFQLNRGCNHACTFCSGYNGELFQKNGLEHLKEQVSVARYFYKITDARPRKVFIGAGNALQEPNDQLCNAIGHVSQTFSPKKISLYGRADTIIRKKSVLPRLKSLGLTHIYSGFESGSDEVLGYVRKGLKSEDLREAAKIVRASGLRLSVMIMPGLGGTALYEAHARGTSSLLSDIHADWVTFMGINPDPSTYYAKHIHDDGNRPLTEREVVQQVKDILEGIQPYGGKVGMFPCDVDTVGKSPITFNVHLDRNGKASAIDLCNAYLARSSS